MSGKWEWHDRNRDETGRFIKADPDGNQVKEAFNLRMPRDVCEQIREHAAVQKMEYGEYVADCLRRIWGLSEGHQGQNSGTIVPLRSYLSAHQKPRP